MDIQGRTPQHGMRPHDSSPPQRPQGYTNPTQRPSVDGFGPPPAPQQPTSPVSAQTPADTGHMLPEGHEDVHHETVPEGPQVLEPTHDQHRSSKPIVLAIVTLLIACGLGVAAFFAFRPETAEKVNKVNVPTNKSNSEAQNSTSTGDVIDDATSDINQQVDGQNDSQDFSDNELSDQTLGL